MKDYRKTEIKVGLTVIIGIVLFLWLLSWARNFNITTTESELKIKFPNVSGLQIGNLVTVNGVQNGYVKDFYIENGDVIVSISVNKNIKLKEDARFELVLTDLMGGKKVEVFPGRSETEIDPNIIQNGIYQTDLAGLLAFFGGIQGDITAVLGDVRQSLTYLNTYLTDKDFNRDLKESVNQMSDISKKLNLMLAENRTDIKSITENTKELTQETKEFIKLNKDDISTSVVTLKNVLQSSDSILKKINYFTDETMAGNNNLGKLLQNDSLFTNITETMSRINELTKVLLDQLKNDGVNVDAHIF
jgi:phospholipid/cholesterol/gamma-HCH transport system substrate-binding protein